MVRILKHMLILLCHTQMQCVYVVLLGLSYIFSLYCRYNLNILGQELRCYSCPVVILFYLQPPNKGKAAYSKMRITGLSVIK